MGDDKPGNKLEEAVSETKGVAEKFVSTLGLTDLIIGGLALYWVRLQYGSLAPTLFISSGHEWVDIALLACGAAFVGKIIALSADLFAAIILILIAVLKLPVYSRFLDALTAYQKAINPESAIVGDPVDLAATYVTKADPRYKAELDRIQTSSTLSYSAFLIAFLYRHYIASKVAGADLPTALTAALIILVVVFLLIGILYQFNEINFLRNILFTLRMLPPTTGQETQSAKPQGVVLPSVRDINVELSSPKPIEVKLSVPHPISLGLSNQRLQPRGVKTMQILINTPEPLKARHAAQVLAALTIIRDALSMSASSAAILRDQLGQIRCGDLNALTQVEEMGQKLLDSQEEYAINGQLQDLVTQAILKQPSQTEDLELVTLDNGSMRGTIKEIIEDVGNWLFALLPQSNSLLPNQDGKQFRESAADIITEKNLPGNAREVAAGTLMVGANQLRQTLRDMRATGVEVVPDSLISARA